MSTRLDKWLVDHGLGARKEVTRWVRRGRVTVNGETVRKPSQHIPPDAEVSLDGVVVEELPWLLAWHKPVGVLSTLRDPWGREGLEGALPPAWSGHFHPVGRLDKDTSGLLLFSRDGQLTQYLLHPKRAVPRTYVATTEVDPPDDLRERLAAGVETAAGTFVAEVHDVQERSVRLTVREGKHRMVRRLLHNAGASVATLHRVSYGAAELGDLKEGEVVPLSDETVAQLRSRGQ